MERPERPLEPWWLRLLALSGLSGVLTIYAWWPMFAAYPHTPEEDGRHFFFQFSTVSLHTGTDISLALEDYTTHRGTFRIIFVK